MYRWIRFTQARNAYIFNDCLVKVILIEKEFLEDLNSEWKDNPVSVLKQITDNLLLIEGPRKNNSR